LVHRSIGWCPALAAMVLVSLLTRGVMLAGPLFSPRRGLDDPDNYLPLARSLAAGEGFALDGRPTAYRPPLYPLLLAPVVAATAGGSVSGGGLMRAVACVHLALGAGAVLLTAASARRWGLSHVRALAAAAVVACDPVLVAQSRSVMTETLAAFLAAATFWALTAPGRLGPVVGGAAFGLSALCRPSAWPAALLTAAAALVSGPGSTPWRQRAVRTATILGTAAAVASPWAVRNALVFGEPVWTTTHGGYTLALANNPVYYDEVVNGPPGAVWTGHNQWLWWDSVNRSLQGLPEPEADRRMRREALAVIAARPGDFAKASLARLARFWAVAPAAAVYSRALRLATAFWTAPLWVALALGLARRRAWTWPRVAAPVTLLALSTVHSVFWTDMRMRAAVVPAIALIAATAALRNGPDEVPCLFNPARQKN
jgi:4-amino-4-deoxy-L-arabinose transferase-like glycosyltransferase